VPRRSSIVPPRFSDPARVDKLRDALPAIDSLMRTFASSQRVPGIAYGVIVDGRLLHVAAVVRCPPARPSTPRHRRQGFTAPRCP
jgi:hypothetical protein